MAHPSATVAFSAYVILLCCDLTLWVSLLTGLLWFEGTFTLDLIWLSSFRILCWAVHTGVSSMVVDESSRLQLKRWVALLCFLPAAYDTVQTVVPGTQRGFTPVPNTGMVVLNAVTATMVHMVWEMAFPSSRMDAKKERKDQEAKALLLRVIRYSRPDFPHLGAAFVFLIFAALFESCIPYYVGQVIDVLSGKYKHGKFMWAIGFMSLYSFGSALFTGLRGGMFMCSLSRLNKRIRHLLFHNLMKQEINFFEDNKPGSLTSRLVSDTDKMGRSVAMNVNVLLRSLVKMCGMLASMLRLSWQLTLLTCVEMPLLALLQNYYNIFYQKTSRELQDCKAEIEQLASSAVGAVRTVRSFRAETQEQAAYEEALDRKLQVQIRKGTYSAVHLLLRRFVTVGLKVAMLLLGHHLISSGQLSSGSLLAFVLYQKDTVTNMKQLVYVYGDILNTVWSAEKVFQLLDRRPKVREAGDLIPTKLEGKLAFKNVTFTYSSRPNETALNVMCNFFFNHVLNLRISVKKVIYEPFAEKKTLEGDSLFFPTFSTLLSISNNSNSCHTIMNVAGLLHQSLTLELSEGKMTALVGPSGGGKSTCISLLQRFYEPQEGEVLLDGVPLHHYQHQYLRNQMAVVSQNPELFSGTVRHNIEYGLRCCTLEEVKNAAKKASIDDFVCRLEQGYDTDVGERGQLLSSGQKQCIALARALIRKPKILLLDEATSFLDANTQHAVQEALSGSAGQTVVVVAHRLQTIEKADHIIFMENGMVLEQGTHEQLMARSGRYYQLREKLFTLDSDQQN